MSLGHDEMPTKIAKEWLHSVLIPIIPILNTSLLTGCILMETKKVIPIFKASDPSGLQPSQSYLYNHV